MKYIVLSVINVFAVFLVSAVVCGLIRGRIRKKPPMAVHVLIVILSGAVFFAVLGAVYFSVHYPADGEALRAAAGGDGITVSQKDDYLFVDGSGEDTALIFYPGAKVDSKAYLPLMEKLAKSGIDCFVICPPLRFAQFDANAAQKIIEGYRYDKIILSGHSMGGVVASSYAAYHPDQVDGLVLLVAYPIEKMDDSVNLLSIYGSEDGVLEIEAYDKAKAFYPADSEEIVIEGGNHAGFGSYGAQSGDGEAVISGSRQQEITAEAIAEFERRL